VKEPIKIEYPLNSSPRILFPRLSSPGGLAEWFADDVRLDAADNNIFIFFWNGSEQKARMIQKKENQFVRYQWLDDDEDCYFEFIISVDELTNDVALIINDFVEPEESEDAESLWNTHVDELKRALGL
jgi:uncharacterized protein YndB with AHSA1/START domain